MLTPAFHFNTLKQYVPVLNEVSHKLLVCYVLLWCGVYSVIPIGDMEWISW